MERYKIDDNYFNDLSSEGPAYWLGVLTADGYLRNNRIEFVVSKKDECWLRLFKSSLRSESPVFTRKRDNCCGISFSSRQIASVLRSYGLSQRKSLVATFCRQVPAGQIHHYIRGLIDGDGSICKCGNGCKVELAGTHDIVSGAHSYLREHLTYDSRIRGQKILKVGNASAIRYGGIINLKNITDYLYSESTLFLKRKQDSARQLLQGLDIVHARSKLQGVSGRELDNLYLKLGTWKNVASSFGIHVRNLHKYRQKLIYHV